MAQIGPVRKGGGGNGQAKGEDGLTHQQRRFVYEYLVDQDAQGAAERAGYSHKEADRADSKLLRVPAVRLAIEVGLAKVRERKVVDAARVLEELERVALADPRQLFNTEGNLKPIQEWTAGEAACIAAVDVVKRNLTAGDGHVDTIIKIRMWDKPKTLEILARHLGMLTERIEIKGDMELVSRLASARRRVAIAIED